MSRAHARLAPSSAHRWMHCAASAALEALYPDGGNVYADEGTAAHELASRCLPHTANPGSFIGTTIEAGQNSFKVDRDMAHHIQSYVDFVRELSDGKQLDVEVKIPIGHLTGEEDATGTADAVVVDRAGRHVCVIDLKYGAGVAVEADGNEQLAIYALGVLERYSLLAEFDTVSMYIHQPRVAGASEPWTLTVAELNDFGARVAECAKVASIVMAVPEVQEIGDGYYRPGEKQCRFCKAKARCPALRAEVVEVVGAAATAEDFAEFMPDTVNSETGNNFLSIAMSKVVLVEHWCKAVRTETERRLVLGEKVEGFKLVRGRQGPRQWTSETEAESVLKGMRLRTDEMYDRKLISPTSAEKLLKSTPKRWNKVSSLISRSEGKISVAPATDERAEVALTATAEDFRELLTADGEMQ